MPNVIVAPGAQTSTTDAEACHISLPSTPSVTTRAVVLELLPRSLTLASRPRTDLMMGGRIDPAYVGAQDVRVRLQNGKLADSAVASYLAIHVGDEVMVQSSFRSSGASCAYVPNLIVGDLGPQVAQSTDGGAQSQ